MTRLLSLTFASLLAFATQAQAHDPIPDQDPSRPVSNLHLDFDRMACWYGSRIVNMQLSVNNETYAFTGFCNSPLFEQVQTQTGVSCRIDSGMCSGMFGSNMIDVICSDGARTVATISCPGQPY